ncbi:hypothetical protein DRF60_01080 [Chryseobacterium elymi]|uniref:Uncharacterized protein n=1 Tax=Chryseobacterium elymi TaxID=395936 RepID=A0A3D9DQL6_9FLAO|nr:hypothetical protein [Chryseobacterium elymi]REC80335.1 hypothetical protein DRF60_01080 [Chryseobacterium elymi]
MSIIKPLGIPKIKELTLENPYSIYEEEMGDPQNNPLTGNIKSSLTACKCKTHTKANSIKELIILVKDAEAMMIQNKLTDIGDRINCLRGIYYGTTWSMDYQKEKSENRNNGFYLYTGLTNVKHDARKMLKCSDQCKGNLFQALYQSPEVIDNARKMTDFGHLIIGLDARRSYISKSTNLPYGGTGLENVTWIGDIGGGAGMLAYRRTSDPNTRAKKIVFDSMHDYGCSVNIEGDIAGYIVGYNIKKYEDIVDPTNNIDYIYVGLQKFFDKDWISRVNAFIAMIGGEIENGVLTNRKEVLDNIIDSVEGFAQFYITLRSSDKSFDKKKLVQSFGYIESCAKEVSEIFLDSLLSLRTHPNSIAFKATKDPEPTKVSASEIAEKSKNAERIMEIIKALF